MSERGNRRRRIAAAAVMLTLVAVFGFRLFDIQVVRAPQLNEDSKDKRSVPVTVPSVRGDIVDRSGNVLASTDQRYDVQLSPKNVKAFYRAAPDGKGTVQVSPEQAFAEIASVTGQTPEEIQEIVAEALKDNPKSDFAYVKRSVDLAALNELKSLGIHWLTFEQNPSRVYPNGAVAGSLIGFVGNENQPQAGLELSQNTCLTGVDGVETYERGADGVALPNSTVVMQATQNGGTVNTTISRDLQWQLQQTVNRKTSDVGAEWGMAVVMDVKTGELVAVAEDGSVDPNNVDGTEPNRREARSFTWPYEPGSTFKTITAAALIDTGKATPETPQLTPDYIVMPDGARFGDAFQHGELPFTLAGILVQSSNVGISLLGQQLSNEVRHDYLTKFGVGQPTDSGMPYEDSGMLAAAADWDVQTQYTTMFGQGLSSTIVQTAGIFQTFANGGVRIPPTLVSGCTAEDGTVTPHDGGDPVTVVTPETSATMMHMMEAVVQESNLKDFVGIPGYRIAGKTGTAEQADGQGGYRDTYVHSFAGIFPAEAPRYVAVVSIAHPQGGDGALAALGGFREAAAATIKEFRIPPSSGAYEPLKIMTE